ncbi:MAG TPA: hypothetical protein VHW96_08210 [Solirubrobacteraceae bacterium]|nr:hypothetical protein [Solirubrobacteraceae bacterium]
MSESTLEAAPSRPDGGEPRGSAVSRPSLRRFGASYAGWLVAAALVVVSAALVVWAKTRPGFDPYGWLTWGHMTLHGGLDTNAAPSWKPLPYVFTVVYALLGSHELRLWMITSAAVSLSGVIFAGRIAYKLTDAPPERRWAGWAAGIFAGLALLGIQDYFHYILSSQSDPMIVALCLAAIDLHLDGHTRLAFAAGALAGLGRPEVWPFLGLYLLWAWVRRPATRPVLIGGVVVMALLWFGIPALTSRTPFVAAANAMDSGRRLTSDQVGGTISRFLELHDWPLEIAALLGVALAAWRRSWADRVTLALAGGVVGWVIVEIAFALHGWPGLARYMFEAAGVMIVLAGVFVGRVLADPPRLGLAGPAATIVGTVAVGLLVLGLVPPALSAARTEHKDIHTQRARTIELGRLNSVIGQLGGAARLRACGEPLTRLEYQTALAYTLGVNVSKIGFKYPQAIAHGNPIVMFTPTSSGWLVQADHQVSAACKSLPQAH